MARRVSLAKPPPELVVFAPVGRPLAILALAALLGGSTLAAGCGVQSGVAGPGQADLTNGKKLFTATCGACHTLADAGTKGVIGPNLDDAYLQPRLNGFDDTSFEALVREQIEVGFPYIRPTPMPPGLLKGKDAQDVAAYVASVAAVALAKQQ